MTGVPCWWMMCCGCGAADGVLVDDGDYTLCL